MIVVDTSALLAIVFEEPERDQYLAILESADGLLISSTIVVEARMVTFGRRKEQFVRDLDALLAIFAFEIVPPGPTEIDAAHKAFVTYGKGSGHKAQLNFGDLFSYALAKSRGLPLLFKGDDFTHTDVRRHAPA